MALRMKPNHDGTMCLICRFYIGMRQMLCGVDTIITQNTNPIHIVYHNYSIDIIMSPLLVYNLLPNSSYLCWKKHLYERREIGARTTEKRTNKIRAGSSDTKL